MKSTFLLLTALLFSFHALAQEDDQSVNLKTFNGKKHEVRIDAIEGLIVPAIDIGYEYVINTYSGVGPVLI